MWICQTWIRFLRNAHLSEKESQLYIFEDNEAGIKMIIKGRSPTMRHVSRIHRVSLDWSFDRINLDSEIQIKHVDTIHQLADMLTKESFTRDEWNHLLRVLNINIFLDVLFQPFLSNGKQSATSESQEGTSKEGSAMAKPRRMNLVSRNFLSTRKDIPQDMSDSNNPGECQSGVRWCFIPHWETNARHEPTSSDVFSSEATG